MSFVDRDLCLEKKNIVFSQKPENIIGMDVRRTYIGNKLFNQELLTNILTNISDGEVGRFSYYQGLNYLATYFLILFDYDIVKAYNVLITILYDHLNYYT